MPRTTRAAVRTSQRPRQRGGRRGALLRCFAAGGLWHAVSGTLLADGPRDRPAQWTDWNVDPLAWLGLATFGWLFLCGLLRIWDRLGVGRVISVRQAWAFAAGWSLLTLALLSPLDALSDQLAAAHMVQHMTLMTLAAPLIAYARPAYVLVWGVQGPSRKLLARIRNRTPFPYRLLRNPLAAVLLFAAALWLWHHPALYAAALRDPRAHDLQHLSFFWSGFLFWRVLLEPGSRWRASRPLAVLMLFAATLQATLLGVLMTLAPRAWYAAYERTAPLWNLTALEDQQLAGLIMWMPACLPYLVAAVWLFALTLREDSAPTAGRRVAVNIDRRQQAWTS